MRIAFISYEFPPDTVIGGIGTYTYQIAKLLSGENFDVHIFAGSHIQSARSLENGITVHRVYSSGPGDFKKNVVLYFEREHTYRAFNFMESPEIHSNAIEIHRLFEKYSFARILINNATRVAGPLHTAIQYSKGKNGQCIFF